MSLKEGDTFSAVFLDLLDCKMQVTEKVLKIIATGTQKLKQSACQTCKVCRAAGLCRNALEVPGMRIEVAVLDVGKKLASRTSCN